MQSSALVISLDLEQHWGVYDHSSVDTYRERLDGGRTAIPEMLERFGRAGIHATWATVGLLLCEGKEEALELYPDHPDYRGIGVSTRQIIEGSGADQIEDPYHYALDLIRRIRQTPGQEVASHTFSHYYCLEPGRSVEDFERDLIAAKVVAARRGLEPTSLVFPRNQYDAEHLAACRRQGFVAFRGNPSAGPYQPRAASETTSRTRLVRLADAYVEVVPSRTLLCRPHGVEGLVNVPASRFLRPMSRWDRHVSGLRRIRICREMSMAAREGADYHLWWHPHNLAAFPRESLELLDAIIEHFRGLRDRHGMQSLTMTEVAGRP